MNKVVELDIKICTELTGRRPVRDQTEGIVIEKVEEDGGKISGITGCA